MTARGSIAASLARTTRARHRHATRRYTIAACLSTLICSLTYQLLLVTVLLLACVRARAGVEARRAVYF
jgi:hypothetical protein